MVVIIWICLAIIFYNYIGYGIILMLITGIKRLAKASNSTKTAKKNGCDEFPAVTVVVAAYNEEDIIEKKIHNCLSLNYPLDKISFIFITDGSEDSTPTIVAQYPQIHLLHQSARQGKTAALNRAMEFVSTPITIFCDANAMLNKSAICRLVRHYQDLKTGGVSGEKKVIIKNSLGSSETCEGFYWKYESLLKRLDSELYTVAGAAGELFSIRTSLWAPLPKNIILDDFVISTRINFNGYRIAYEPHAYASELPSVSIEEERKRKVRMSAGAFQAMLYLKQIFNVFEHPVLFFQFFSHRILRWTLTPLSFPTLLITNILALIYSGNQFLFILLILQMLFYLVVAIGALFNSGSGFSKPFRLCYYLVFMNWTVYLGFWRFLRGKQSVVWEKAKREELAMPI